MNQTRKRNFLFVLGPLLLVIALIAITYAFFNYTRTGVENRISVGRISFTSTQNNTINLENVFPTSSNNLNNTNSDTVTINTTGDTNYQEGIEYKVTLEDVNNTINGKEIPISFNIAANNLGTKSSNYYNERGSTTNVYNLVENGIVEEDKDILVGYIKPDAEGVNGSIDITAYIDSSNVAISDTLSTIENGNLIYGETTSEWVDGRTVFTTSEWNSLSGDGIYFKVKVEANEGIWVEEEQFYVLKNLNDITAWKNIRANITSIEFHKDGIAPASPLDTIDATDVTSAGTVTVYTVDDGLGTNTKKAIVVADDTIYAPGRASMLFMNMSKLVNFNSENFKVDNVLAMPGLFWNCSALANISSISTWNTSNVQSMFQMFHNCTSLTNIDGLINWNTSSVQNISGMFDGCSNLVNVNGLINWNTLNVTDMYFMFSNRTSLTSVDLSSWNMSSVTNDSGMFQLAGIETLIMPNNYTRIDDAMFNHNDSYTGESFTIPKSVTSVGNSHIFYNFGQDNTFNKFIVESGSTSLKTIDDILYTYDGTRLISVPRGKTFTNNTYEMPEGITFMNELSFSRNQNIETVILPNSYVIERYIKANDSSNTNNNNYGFLNSGNSLSVAIYQYTSVKRYEVKNDNTRYMSYDGCIYSKDGSELIAVPFHYNGVLNIKSGTTTIGQEAFWDFENVRNDMVTQINIPASVTTIETNQLTTLNTLMSRSTNPVTITIDSGNTAYQIVNNKIVAR